MTGAWVLKLFVFRTFTHAGVVVPPTTRDGKVSELRNSQHLVKSGESWLGDSQCAVAEATRVARATKDFNIV